MSEMESPFQLDTYYPTRGGVVVGIVSRIDEQDSRHKLRGFVGIEGRNIEYSWTQEGFASVWNGSPGHPYDLMPGPSFADISNQRIAELESEIARLQKEGLSKPSSEGQAIWQDALDGMRGHLDDIHSAVITLNFLLRIDVRESDLDLYRNAMSWIALRCGASLEELNTIHYGTGLSMRAAT